MRFALRASGVAGGYVVGFWAGMVTGAVAFAVHELRQVKGLR